MLRQLLAGLTLCAGQASAVVFAQTIPTAEPPPPVSLKIPGLTIDIQRQLVDIEATVCLNRGTLELIACTAGTKEHESIVSVKVKPRHVHLGLLLIGAQNGKPAARRRLIEDDPHSPWVDVPPTGDPIVVSLLFNDDSGKLIERPIGDFVIPAGDERAEGVELADRFPDAVVFAGSHLIRNDGEARYLADLQGNLISVATFGDEVLCLPGTNSRDDGELLWAANPDTIPKIGTRATLRLRPKNPRKVHSD